MTKRRETAKARNAPPKPPWAKSRPTAPAPKGTPATMARGHAYPDHYSWGDAETVLQGLSPTNAITHHGRFGRKLTVRLVERHARHSPVHDIAPWQAIELIRNWRPWARGSGVRLTEHVAISYPYARLDHHVPPPPGEDPEAWIDGTAQLAFRIRQADHGEDGRDGADPIPRWAMPWLSHADAEDPTGQLARVDSAYAQTPWVLAHALLERLDENGGEPSTATASWRGRTVQVVEARRRYLLTATGSYAKNADQPIRLRKPPYDLLRRTVGELCRQELSERQRYRRGERMPLVTPGPVPPETAEHATSENEWRASLTPEFRAAVEQLPNAMQRLIRRQCEPPVPHAPSGTRHRRATMRWTRPYGEAKATHRRRQAQLGQANGALTATVATLTQGNEPQAK